MATRYHISTPRYKPMQTVYWRTMNKRSRHGIIKWVETRYDMGLKAYHVYMVARKDTKRAEPVHEHTITSAF